MAGISGLGALGASKTAKADMVMRQRELEALKQQQGYMQMMGMNALDAYGEENDYIRQMEALNRQIAQQERQFQIDQMMEYRGQLGEERQFEIDRQVEMDKEAARMQQFQLEQLLRNQTISAKERKFAEQQLAEQKAIAAGERESDMRRFYEERAMAQAEREFVTKQFYTAEQDMRTAQSRDLALRDRLTGQVDSMQQALRRAEMEMGAMPTVPTMSKADLDGEIARREALATADVDRAATRVASINEANLIRTGIDGATTGNAKRADITREIADQYQTARGRAYDEALAYITGQQDVAMRGYQGQMDQRNARLAEIMGIEGAGFEQLRGLPDVQSLAGLTQMAQMIPSGVYSRGIASANFQNSVNQSAIYDQAIGSRLSNYNVGRSAADGSWTGVGSAAMKPYDINLMDPSAFFGAATNIGTGIYNDANERAAGSAEAAGNAWSQFGGQLQDLGEWWSNRESAGGTGLTSSQRPPQRPRPMA